jgi:phosphonate transport system substrate-binding protein
MGLTLYCATFLSPALYSTYKYITEYLSEQLGIPVVLGVGESFDGFVEGQIDMGFICGLTYVHLTNQCPSPVELLAAPVLLGPRYHDEPIYFSDVIVRRESAYQSFEDLEKSVWAYNESSSHSGYNLVEYSLFKQGKTHDFFGRMIASGSHLQSLCMVLGGVADATAIDSHVMDVLLQNCGDIAEKIRILSTLGPSTIPPVVAATRLDEQLKRRIRMALLTMHSDEEAASKLHEGLIGRFLPIMDTDYDDIREMFTQVEASKVREVEQFDC